MLAAERRLTTEEVEVLVGGRSAGGAALALTAAAAGVEFEFAALGLGLLDEAGDLGGDEAAVAAAWTVVGNARRAVLCEK